MVALEFVSAPLPPIPIPVRVRGLVLARVWPFKSMLAPLLMEIVLLEAPNAVVLPAFSVPAETVIAPVKLPFEPERVAVLAPTLYRLLLPEKFPLRLKLLVPPI